MARQGQVYNEGASRYKPLLTTASHRAATLWRWMRDGGERHPLPRDYSTVDRFKFSWKDAWLTRLCSLIRIFQLRKLANHFLSHPVFALPIEGNHPLDLSGKRVRKNLFREFLSYLFHFFGISPFYLSLSTSYIYHVSFVKLSTPTRTNWRANSSLIDTFAYYLCLLSQSMKQIKSIFARRTCTVKFIIIATTVTLWR